MLRHTQGAGKVDESLDRTKASSSAAADSSKAGGSKAPVLPPKPAKKGGKK